MLYTTFSQSTLKFEVSYVLNETIETNNNVLCGKLVDCLDKPQPIVVPEAVEDLSTMEGTSESEIYLMLSELGCDLGPQFQLIKKLYIGKKGKLVYTTLSQNFLC